MNLHISTQDFVNCFHKQTISYEIDPFPKPRMTRSDKWKKRQCVLNYYAFKDEVRAKRIAVGINDHLIFNIAMPKSWSKKKRDKFNGKPHTQKPDLDNLIKAIWDASMKDDSSIWKVSAEKRWAVNGSIVVVS